MTCTRLLIALSLAGVLLTTGGLLAKTPIIMNYQGRLTDDTGTPVDGDVDIVFLIYDAPEDGTVVWEEAQTVTVKDGLFSTRIGINHPIDPDIFVHVEPYLAVSIDDQEITREQLVSSPYAIQAENSRTANQAIAAEYLNGQQASDFAPAIHNHTGEDIVTGMISHSVIDAYVDLLVSGRIDGGDPTDLVSKYVLDGSYAGIIHEHDASDVTSGTLATDFYNAYQDLNDAGYLNNDHNFDLLNRIQSDGRFAAKDHDHTGYYIYGQLSDGGYMDLSSGGDLMTLTATNDRFSRLSHTHTPTSIQCKFHYRVVSPSGSVMADGVINADGSTVSGGPLNSVYWDATNSRYVLNFTLLPSFSIDTHVTMITPVSDQGRYATIGQVPPDDLAVYIWEL